MGVAIRPSALMTTLAAPCIACFDRRLMVAAGPRILVRQRAMIESAESAAAAAETSRERRRATTRRRSDRDGLRATSRPRGQRDPRSGCTGDRAQQRGFGRDGGGQRNHTRLPHDRGHGTGLGGRLEGDHRPGGAGPGGPLGPGEDQGPPAAAGENGDHARSVGRRNGEQVVHHLDTRRRYRPGHAAGPPERSAGHRLPGYA